MTRRISPRDVHLATTIGGVFFGLAMMLLGLLFDTMAFGPATPNQFPEVVVGVSLFSVGAAFTLVSGIILPALRAMRAEVPPKG